MAGALGRAPGRRMMRGRDLALWCGSAGVVLLCVGAWSALVSAGWVSRVFLPSPQATLAALEHGLADGTLPARAAQTTQRMLIGWLLASILGAAIGAAIGASPVLRRWLLPGLELLRPLPASALLPAGIALMGLTPGMVLAAIAFGASWPVLLAAAHGVAAVDARLREVASLLRIGGARYVWKFALPNAAPDILAGMRLSMTASLIVALVGEMLTAQEGLGTSLLTAARRLRSDDLYAAVIVVGLIGLASNTLLALAERRLVRWQRH